MSTLKIALDAGHGLHTAGRRCLAQYDPYQTREWQLNDRIMDKLQKELKNYDCETIRVDDTTGAQDVGLATRVNKANSWGADIYLSMHHNGGINGGTGGGTVVYHYCSTSRGIELASLLYNRIVAKTGLVGNRSSKVKKSGYYVLVNTKMRAYLVENGFMDSATDIPIIITDEHAEKTVDGILEWLISDCGLSKVKNTAPEPDKNVDTDTNDLGVGAKVIVNGDIYGTGKGKGGSIRKYNARMYVVGYAGDSYPHCWGVSAKKGGARQGWAAADILTVLEEGDESMVDGSSTEYFTAASYSGFSIVSALKSIGEESSYAYRKKIAAVNKIEDYQGSAEQNSKMLKLLRAGKLIKPD